MDLSGKASLVVKLMLTQHDTESMDDEGSESEPTRGGRRLRRSMRGGEVINAGTDERRTHSKSPPNGRLVRRSTRISNSTSTPKYVSRDHWSSLGIGSESEHEQTETETETDSDEISEQSNETARAQLSPVNTQGILARQRLRLNLKQTPENRSASSPQGTQT